MKKFVIVLAVLMSSACTVEVKNSEPTPSADRSYTSEDRYVDTLRDAGIGSEVSDASLIKGGHLVCDSLDEYGVEFTITGLMNGTDDTDIVATTIVASVVAFCPNNAQLVEDFVNESDYL